MAAVSLGRGPAVLTAISPPPPQVALLETNPYLLALTIVVSIVHSVFEFLAFKNGRGGPQGPVRGHGGLGALGCVWEGRVHSLPLRLGPFPRVGPASPTLQRPREQPPTPSPETPGRRVWRRGRGRPAALAKVWSAPPGSRAGELQGWEQGSPTAAPTALPGRLPVGGDPSGVADRAHLSGKVTAVSPEGPKVPEANRGDGQCLRGPGHLPGTVRAPLPVSLWKPRSQSPEAASLPHVYGSERLVTCPQSYSSQAAQPELGSGSSLQLLLHTPGLLQLLKVAVVMSTINIIIIIIKRVWM